jgi:hypothetical protein
MAPIPVPAAVTAPIPADVLDDTIAANRAEIIKLVAAHNALDARLTAEENKAPAVGTPIVTVLLTAAQTAQMAAVGPGGVVILRGTTGPDHVMQRQS